jgi:hypothetical protein
VQELAESGSRTLLGVPAFALYLLNPLVGIVAGFQRALYGFVQHPDATEAVLFTESLGWYAAVLGAILVVSGVILRLAWGYFFSRSGDFAEEL